MDIPVVYVPTKSHEPDRDSGNNGGATRDGAPRTRNKDNDDTMIIQDVSQHETATDLWSAAYSQAVKAHAAKSGEVPKGETILILFDQLKVEDKKKGEESAYAKGARHLEKMKGPLKTSGLCSTLRAPLLVWTRRQQPCSWL